MPARRRRLPGCVQERSREIDRVVASAASAICEGLGLPRDAAWRVVCKFYGLRADDVDLRAVMAVVRPPSASWYGRGTSALRPTARPTCVRDAEEEGEEVLS